MNRSLKIILISIVLLLLAILLLVFIEKKFQVNLKYLLYILVIINSIVVSRLLMKDKINKS
jgi:hypothetical protein